MLHAIFSFINLMDIICSGNKFLTHNKICLITFFLIFFCFYIYFKHSFSIVSLRGKKKQLHNLNRLKRFALWTQCQVDYNILLRKLSQANWIQGFLKNIMKVLSEFVFYRRKLSLKMDNDRNGQIMNIFREIKDWNKQKWMSRLKK